MLVVIALGSSALLRPAEPVIPETLRAGVRTAAEALAPIAARHQLVIGVGDGPQVGLLALQTAASSRAETYPLDAVSARLERVIGYMLEQEMGSLLPPERSLATVLTMASVDPDDPAFTRPTKFIGPVYLREEAEHLAALKGWSFRPAGDKCRRVVASPEPRGIVELRPIRWLLEHDTVVIAEGAGCLAAVRQQSTGRTFSGVECVIDADLTCELLARDLGADLFVLLTDAGAVYVDWGRPGQRPIRHASPSALSALHFAADSMGAKVTAACRFVQATGRDAAIGAVGDLSRILTGDAGTTVSLTASGITFGTEAFAPAHRGRSSESVLHHDFQALRKPRGRPA